MRSENADVNHTPAPAVNQ